MVVLLNLPGGSHDEWIPFMAVLVLLILILRGVQILQLRLKQRKERRAQRYTMMDEINLN